MAKLVTDALAWWTRALPDQPAFVFEGDQVTYRELGEWSDRVGRRLVDEHGIQPGDVVAVAGVNSLEWCIAAVAAVKAGAIVSPFNYRYTASELDYLVENAEPRVVFSDETQRPKLDELIASGRRFDIVPLADVADLRSGPVERFRVEMSSTDPIVLAYTSGTTGQPKGLVYTHQSILNGLFEYMLKDPTPPEETRQLLALPLFSVPGIQQAVLQGISRGATTIVMADFDPAQAVDLLVKHRVSQMNGVPVIWERMSQVPGFDELDLSHLKVAMVGGARVSNELQQRWAERGVVLRHLYGMTEVGGVGTVPRPADAMANPALCGDGSLFTEIRTVRPDGTDCDPGEEGEILMRGPAMMAGYWRNPEATADTVRDGWIHSGDLGVIDENGFLRFVDRLKDLIISGGFNVSASEVENVISRVPGVQEVAVIAVPDAQWGEAPAAIITADRKVDPEEVLRAARDELAVFKVPRYVVQVDGPLPRMTSGKLAKRDLRSEYADLPSRATRH